LPQDSAIINRDTGVELRTVPIFLEAGIV
jgi:hypothetical protein